MRNLSKQPAKNYYKSPGPARPLSLGKPAHQQIKSNEVQVGIYKYNCEEILGKGYSSKVFKGVEMANVYKRYAIKVVELKKFRGSSLQMLEAEIDIHKNLVHQNILRLYQIIKTPYFYYLVLEYCPHGNLHEYIRQKKRLSESNAIEIMSQILEGYNYLSGQNIIHRDFKPANILRVGNKWKISDFGFAVKSKYGFKDRINVGTPLYMPPQTIIKTYYSSKTDIFALGIILYEMIEGRTPWESSNEKELIEKLKKDLVLPMSIRHPKARELITRCCQLNQSKRMSKDELQSFSFSNSVQQASNVGLSSRGGSSSTSKIREPRKSSIALQNIPPLNPQLQIFKNNGQKLNLQYQFTQNLYTCVKNKDCFLFTGEISQIFTAAIFKLSLRLLRQLCDKNKNHFKLKSWEQFSKSKQWQNLAILFSQQLQRQQKQYFQYIKHFQIKIIRSVNRRFMDLSSSAPIAQRFYSALKQFLIPLIRQHNHQLMMLHLQRDGTNRHNDKIQAMDALYTIYNVCDIRTNNATAQELSISDFKVLQDFKTSNLSYDDYVDIRRLIRNI